MLRWAVVDTGAEADALGRVRPRLRGGKIAAVVDSDARRAVQLAAQLGASVATTSVQDLHERHSDAFDAWAALTPAGWLLAPHENRPLETDVEQWHRNGGAWQWGHAFRFLPSVRALEDSVASGKLGAPGLVRAHHWQTSGNTRMAMMAQMDTACGLIDQRPTMLFAQGHGAVDNGYLQVHLGFADDRMALLDCTTSLAGQDDYFSLSVIGATGAAYADDHHNMQLLYRGERPLALRTSQGDRALLQTFEEFVEATVQGRPPLCGAAQWQRARELTAAIELSLSTGQAVALKGASQ